MSIQIIYFICVVLVSMTLLRVLLKTRKAKKHISELEESLESLGKVLRHRADLVNEIAHEIKNPITAMLCSVETLNLLLSDSLDEQNKRTFSYMKEYGDHILRLVSDFIDVSRVEGGALKAKPQNTSVLDSIESVVGLLTSSALTKKISIHILKSDEEIFAYVDEKHLKQIVFNLVHNAIKFTPKNGEIEIRVKADEQHKIIKIAVRDNGYGIPKEFQNSVFDLYSRYDGNQAKNNIGTGLGLALCKSLVHLAGGEIYLTSIPGKGTTFEFTIPIVTENINLDQKKQDLVSTSKPLNGQCFLIVDQDEASRNSIASLIEAWGGLVDQVNSAKDAVQAITGYHYDAVVLDKPVDCENLNTALSELSSSISSGETTFIVADINCDNKSNSSEQASNVKVLAKPFNGEKLLKTLVRTGKFQVSH